MTCSQPTSTQLELKVIAKKTFVNTAPTLYDTMEKVIILIRDKARRPHPYSSCDETMKDELLDTIW
jgi:hypothetical protein